MMSDMTSAKERDRQRLKLLRDNLAKRLFIYIERGQAIADTAWLRTLKDQSFVGVDVSCDFGDVRFHKANVLPQMQTVSLRYVLPGEASPSTSASICARELISVTQTRNSFGRSG